jgi:hypothetical protein
VFEPANILKIDSVQVDARTVHDVKVSEDGKIAIISREGASNRKNGIIIIDVSNPRDVKIISEYTKNLTGGVHNLFIYQNHVYALSAGQKYYILNIEDPVNPVEVGMFELGKEGQTYQLQQGLQDLLCSIYNIFDRHLKHKHDFDK